MEEMKQSLKDIVAQRLSAAPDSAAKAELIEELSENLYCRYTDLTGAGAEPEEARAQAVDALGDTNELVEYLKGLEPDQPLPELVLDPSREDGGQIEEILHNVEGIIKGAIHKAKTTIQNARDTVREEQTVKDAERRMKEAEQAMNRKEAELDAAREALEELERAQEALMEVGDQAAVAQALAALREKFAAKQSEVEALEDEFDELEDEFDELEDELAAEEDELAAEEDEEEENLGKGWRVTYESHGRTVELNSDDLKSSVKDMVKDIKQAVREAANVAKDACKTAAEATGEFCEDLSGCTQGTAVETDRPIDAAQLQAIDVQNYNGEITVRMSQPADGDVLVDGDTGDFKVYRSEDGVLTVRPVRTETTAFFSGRGVFSSGSPKHVVLELPCRSWKNIRLVTTNGDIRLEGTCPVDTVSISSVMGDVNGVLPSCENAVCRTTNGDMNWAGDVSELKMDSVNGDLHFSGRSDKATVRVTTGDVELEGSICAASMHSVSGDLRLCSSVLPDCVEMGTTSGDLLMDIPDAGSFTARFRSTSGNFTSDFFTGKMGGRNCVFHYQGGGERNYSFTSISGDAKIRKYQN